MTVKDLIWTLKQYKDKQEVKIISDQWGSSARIYEVTNSKIEKGFETIYDDEKEVVYIKIDNDGI